MSTTSQAHTSLQKKKKKRSKDFCIRKKQHARVIAHAQKFKGTLVERFFHVQKFKNTCFSILSYTLCAVQSHITNICCMALLNSFRLMGGIDKIYFFLYFKGVQLYMKVLQVHVEFFEKYVSFRA